MIHATGRRYGRDLHDLLRNATDRRPFRMQRVRRDQKIYGARRSRFLLRTREVEAGVAVDLIEDGHAVLRARDAICGLLARRGRRSVALRNYAGGGGADLLRGPVGSRDDPARRGVDATARSLSARGPDDASVLSTSRGPDDASCSQLLGAASLRLVNPLTPDPDTTPRRSRPPGH